MKRVISFTPIMVEKIGNPFFTHHPIQCPLSSIKGWVLPTATHGKLIVVTTFGDFHVDDLTAADLVAAFEGEGK